MDIFPRLLYLCATADCSGRVSDGHPGEGLGLRGAAGVCLPADGGDAGSATVPPELQ